MIPSGMYLSRSFWTAYTLHSLFLLQISVQKESITNIGRTQQSHKNPLGLYLASSRWTAARSLSAAASLAWVSVNSAPSRSARCFSRLAVSCARVRVSWASSSSQSSSSTIAEAEGFNCCCVVGGARKWISGQSVWVDLVWILTCSSLWDATVMVSSPPDVPPLHYIIMSVAVGNVSVRRFVILPSI